MSSLNKVILIGNLGKDPEVRTMQSGDKVASLSIATSETWKDKATGEKKEKTEWHRVSVFGNVANVCENYLAKGSKVYIEGKLETRKWTDQSGVEKYSTEVKVSGYDGRMIMLDGKRDSGGQTQQATQQAHEFSHIENVHDEIPF